MRYSAQPKFPIVWIIGLCFAVIVLIVIGLPNSFIGENKITDGMKLRFDRSVGFSVRFDSTRNLLHLQGSLDIGILSEIERMLSAHPESTGVVLDSDGGNVYQARGIAHTIEDQLLDTYVFRRCYSACTIVYLAGKTRYLAPSAKRGFHRYRIDSEFLEMFIDVEKEQEKDLVFFRRQIPDPVFVNKIFEYSLSEMWVPDLAELVESGVVHEVLGDSAHQPRL